MILLGRSDFSIGDSVLSPSRIVQAAKEGGFAAALLADTMTVSSFVEFTGAAEKEGVKPLYGVRLRVVATGETKADKKVPVFYPTVIIKDQRGMEIVYELLTKAFSPERFYYEARLKLDDVLEAFNPEHLIMLTGDLTGALGTKDGYNFIESMVCKHGSTSIYGQWLVADNMLCDRTIKEAVNIGDDLFTVPSVAMPLVVHENGGVATLHVMNAIANNMLMAVPSGSKRRAFSNQLDIDTLTPAARTDYLAQCVDAIGRVNKRYGMTLDKGDVKITAMENAEYIIGQCTYKWQKMDISLPVMADDEDATLVALCKQGFNDRLLTDAFGYQPSRDEIAEKYAPRLKYEIGVLKELKFANYFLLVREIINWSKEQGIMVGPGRGSAGGSLVAYCLGITDVDPIRFGLIFERFINPSRLDLPDVDIDFASQRREEVINFIYQKWGEDKVAGIANYNELKSASALRDSGKVMGLDERQIGCSKFIPSTHGIPMKLSEAATEVPAIKSYAARYPDQFAQALAVEGKMRATGRHAAGIVVAGEPLVKRAVVDRRDGNFVVNWDKRIVEDMGLVKVDILGLQTLDLLKMAVQYIKERTGADLDLYKIPLDDQKVLAGFGKGNTVGVFQFESSGMRKLLNDLAVSDPLNFEDISAATALYRPGPMDSGMMEDYVARKSGYMAVEYDHPEMEEILKDQYGVMVYQESVMKVAQVIAGYSLPDADKLRKIMGKKLPAAMAEQKDKWVEGCKDTVGMSDIEAEALFEKVSAFAGYGFNKSHAVAYTLISYMSMYVKTYHPLEFYAAALTILDEGKQRDLCFEAKSLGITVTPPEINTSSNRFEILNDETLCAPFNIVKGISDNTANAIMLARKDGPFASSADLEERVERRKCNVRHRTTMQRVGTFVLVDGETIPAMASSRARDHLELCPSIAIQPVPIKGRMKLTKARLDEISANMDDYKDLHGEKHPDPYWGTGVKFMAIIDAPKARDVDMGQLMNVGWADTLKKIMRGAGLRPEDMYMTALLKKEKSEDQITEEELAEYAPFLQREIDILQPEVIVTFGSPPTRWFFPQMKGGIVDNANRAIYMPETDCTIIPSISPGMIHFDPKKKDILEETFNQVAKIFA